MKKKVSLTVIMIVFIGAILSPIEVSSKARSFIHKSDNVMLNDTIPFDSINNLIKIIKRESWHAKEPIFEMTKHIPTKITIHNSGVVISDSVDIIEETISLQNFSQKEALLENGHIRKPWADIPYHYIIYPKGEIVEGRNINYAGDTNTSYNPESHVLIDVAGNFQTQTPTDEQIQSLINLCVYISEGYHISIDSIKGHKDYAVGETDCPGENLYVLLPSLIDTIKLRLKQ